MKKIVCLFLSICLLITASFSIPMSSYAQDNINELVSNDIAYTDEESIDDPDENAPAGYDVAQDETTITPKRFYSSSGNCGDQLAWALDNGTLTITGSGEMSDYSTGSAPWYSKADEITSLVISDGVTRLGKNAFYNCTKLTNVEIAESVTEMAQAVFYGCSSLKSITLPESITYISSGTFVNCTSLTDITCNGVTDIDDYAFQNTGFKNVIIGKNLTNLSELAYFNCSIEGYIVENGNTAYKALDGVLYSADGDRLVLYPTNKAGTELTIGSSVKTIGSCAFCQNKNLKEIVIPGNVTYISDSAFQQCQSLENAEIPDSVTHTGYFVFYKCPLLKSVSLGNGLDRVDYKMFTYCDSLSQIDFGTGKKTISAQAFAYCPSLTSVTLPDNVTQINNGSFGCCYNLTEFTSYGLSEIPYQAFYSCTSLEKVNLNEGTKNINRAAFCYCDSLKNITLPESVTYVHPYAFNKDTVITCKDEEMRKFGINGYRYLQDVSITGTKNYSNAYSVLKLVNEERQKQGLNALVMNESLLETAMMRAGEIAVCFSHTRPDGSSCAEANSLLIAENIAGGQGSPESVMNAWMNSSGHKENILLAGAKTIGIGCFEIDGVLYWVQCFGNGNDSTDCTMPSNAKINQTISLATEEFTNAVTGTDIVWSSDNSTYSYNFYVDIANTSIYSTKTTTAKLYLKNAGYEYFSVPINNTGVAWISSSGKIAAVSSSGKITGTGKGTATINAKLKYFSACEKLTVSKYTQKISCSSSITKTYGNSSFSLNAKITQGNGKLSYTSSNSKVATVSSSGKVTIKGVGKCTITVKAAETSAYNSASKKITITIKPKATSISSVSAKSKGFTVKWKKQATQTTGYQIQYSTSSKFTNAKTITVSKNSTTSKTISKLSAKKKYYVRVRTYKTVSGTKYYSSWSSAKSVTTKK